MYYNNNSNNVFMVAEGDIGRLVLEYDNDYDAISPREFDCISNLIIGHRDYTLGDNNVNYDMNDYNNWYEALEDVTTHEDVIEVLPVYLYDHGGLTINTTGFSCGWDAYAAGLVWITRDDVLEYYGEVNDDTIRRAVDLMQAEVEEYDCYIRGDFVRYTLTTMVNGEEVEVDSCGGFMNGEHLSGELRGHLPDEYTCLVDELQWV